MDGLPEHIKTIEQSNREGWFLINGDLEIRFLDNSSNADDMVVEADCEEDAYTDYEIEIISKSLLEFIIKYYETLKDEDE